MQKWSKGELGIMWLGIGAAVFVVAPIGFDGMWTAVVAILGAIAFVYGGVLAWQGLRKDPEDEADGSGSSPDGPGSRHRSEDAE